VTTAPRGIRRLAPIAALSGTALILAAAAAGSATASTPPSDVSSDSAPTAGATAAERYTTPLADICPETIVFQTNWWPEVDHAVAYELIGPDGELDTSNNTYTGPLGSTGVNLEIRAGGPAIGFQSVTSLLYQDDSILLGLIGTDEQVINSADLPTTGVLAWYQTSPQIFLWGNPDWDFQSVQEIGESGETVLGFEGSPYLDVFVGQGLLNADQIDTSYQGGPSRFVAADGNIVQQGFLTAEPYQLEHETPEWNRPVKFLLVSDEYPVYQNSIAVRSDRLETDGDCLAALVPLLQQAAVDYIADPQPINDLLVDYVSRIDGGGFTLSDGLVADATAKQIEYGIVANGTDGVFGSFDDARVQTIIETLTPALTASGTPPADGLVPGDLYTNDLLDPSISLP
jgi:hypothetical protein